MNSQSTFPRILLLGNISSPHINKWAQALAAEGCEVGIFSLSPVHSKWFENHPCITLLYAPRKKASSVGLIQLMAYFFLLPKLWSKIRAFSPHILHAHYATSYGFLGALSGFRPFYISAWGSDIFEFPKRSFFHRMILKLILNSADKLFVTSKALKAETEKYCLHPTEVIPFGINFNEFYPRSVTAKTTINIGTIKAMENEYGIKTILEAFRLIRTNVPTLNIKLFLIGAGSQTNSYFSLVKSWKLENDVVFTGKIPYNQVADYHNTLDIFLNVSECEESFGVSIIEAMACAKPVIVSDTPGSREIVRNEFGIMIRKRNVKQLAQAILELVNFPEKAKALAEKGYRHVRNNYDFNSSLDAMLNFYSSEVNLTSANS